MTDDLALPLPFRDSHGLPKYDVYRCSSRAPDPPVIPSPSWRTLLGPFGRASLFVVVVLAPHAFTTTRVREFDVRTGDATTTKLHAEWLDDGTVRVVQPVRPKPEPLFLGWGGGC